MSDSTKLTPREFARMQHLRLLQSDHSRWFSTEEWDELKALQTRAFAEMGDPSDANPRVKSWETLAPAPEKWTGGDMSDIGDAGDDEKFEQGKAPKGWHWPPAQAHDNSSSVEHCRRCHGKTPHSVWQDSDGEFNGSCRLCGCRLRGPQTARFADRLSEMILALHHHARCGHCLPPSALIMHPDDYERLLGEMPDTVPAWTAKGETEIYFRNVRVYRSPDATRDKPVVV